MNRVALLVGVVAMASAGLALAVNPPATRSAYTLDPTPSTTWERLGSGGVSLIDAIKAAEKLVDGVARSAEIGPTLEEATVLVYGTDGPVLVHVDLRTGAAARPKAIQPFPGEDVKGDAKVDGELWYYDHEVGEGAAPGTDGFVRLQYTAYLLTGEEVFFHVNRNRTKTAIGPLPTGLRKGVATMQPGGRRKLIVPPHLAKGAKGTIPPKAWLVYEVELFSVVDD